MVGEVTSVQTAKTERVYSKDGMLYSGMSIKDAGEKPENIEIFGYADRDENGIISDNELSAYNAFLVAKSSAVAKPETIDNADKKQPLQENKKNETTGKKGLKMIVNTLEAGILGGLVSTVIGSALLAKGTASTVASAFLLGGIAASIVSGVLLTCVAFTVFLSNKKAKA